MCIRDSIYCAGTDLYAEGRSPEPLGLSQYTELGPASEDVDVIYNQAYKAIRMANTALFYADITEQTPNIPSRVGEVKYLRANAYFLLVQTYGGVPVILEQIDSPILEVERNSAEEVYTAIISDLTDALGAVGTDTSSGRVNQRAVQHLLAKVHLTRGYEAFAAANDFDLAASLADAAIGGQGLNLTFDELCDYTNSNNEEVLFAVQYSGGSVSADPTELGNQQARFFGPYMGGTEVAGAAPNRSNNLLPTDSALRLFTPDDERSEATFMTVSYNTYLSHHTHVTLRVSAVRTFYEPACFTQPN